MFSIAETNGLPLKELPHVGGLGVSHGPGGRKRSSTPKSEHTAETGSVPLLSLRLGLVLGWGDPDPTAHVESANLETHEGQLVIMLLINV